MRRVLACVCLLCAVPFALAQQALNNDAIIKMVKAGLSDDVVIATVNASAAAYDTSTDGLIALKKQGVSDKVVAALISRNAGGAPTRGGDRRDHRTERGPIAPRHDHRGPALGEAPRRRCADATGSAGDNDHLIAEVGARERGWGCHAY